MYGMIPKGFDKLIDLGLICIAIVALALAAAIIYGIFFLPSPWSWIILSAVVGIVVGVIGGAWFND